MVKKGFQLTPAPPVQVIKAATAIDAGSLWAANLIAKNSFATIPALSTK